MEFEKEIVDEQEEFVQLLTRHQSRLYAFVFTLLGDPSRVADVFQETNMVLWRKQAEFDHSREFLPWAFAVARNQVRAAWQKQGRERLQFDETTIERIEEQASDIKDGQTDRLEAFAQCMNELPEDQRDLLRKRYQEGVSLEVIASKERRTPNALAVAIHRLRRALVNCVQGKLRNAEGGMS